MNTTKLVKQLEQLADEEYKAKTLMNYPTNARRVIGVPKNVIMELSRCNGSNPDWRKVVDKELGNDSFEEILLKMAIMDMARPDIQEHLERTAKIIPLIDSPTLCDRICLTMRVAVNKPKEVLCWLKQYYESGVDMEQRFALVCLLDHFINSDYINNVLDIYSNIKLKGEYSKDAWIWGCGICFMMFPQKTTEALRKITFDNKEELLVRLKTYIVNSPRFKEDTRTLLDSVI